MSKQAKPKVQPLKVPPVGLNPHKPLDLKEQELATATVVVPVVRTKGYTPQHVDLRLRSHTAQTLRDIRDGLSQMGYTLKNGKAVESPQSALIWILENIEVDKVKKKN